MNNCILCDFLDWLENLVDSLSKLFGKERKQCACCGRKSDKVKFWCPACFSLWYDGCVYKNLVKVTSLLQDKDSFSPKSLERMIEEEGIETIIEKLIPIIKSNNFFTK